MDDMYFQTLKAYYSCIHKWLVSLRRLLPAATSAERRQRAVLSTPADCHRPSDLHIMTNNWPWLSSACFACISKHKVDQLGAQAWAMTTFLCGNKTATVKVTSLIFFPLISHILLPALSAFHIPSTSGLCCAPCSTNSSCWKSCGSSAATRVFSWRCG